MPLSDPRSRRALRKELDRLWVIGRSLVLGWSVIDDHLALLLLPNSRLPEIETMGGELVASGPRRMSPSAIAELGRWQGLDVVIVDRPVLADMREADAAAIDELLKPYGIAFTERRAVGLLDIVGFSRASRLEQAALLNSLVHSIAIAQRRCRQLELGVALGRMNTGDGFYLWNRRGGPEADVNLVTLLILALADNRLTEVEGGLVPVLRTAVTVGSHFSFFQPGTDGEHAHEFIVGESTIAAARMSAAAQARQILVGARMIDGGLNATRLIEATQTRLVALGAVPFASGTLRISAVRLSGGVSPQRSVVRGKHGIEYRTYNMRVDLAVDGGEEFSLGLASGPGQATATDGAVATNDGVEPGRAGASAPPSVGGQAAE
ncbi:MAG: hypothetical protein JNK67_29055 [Alphaproteobacteria bacterium]|nr:hypothetical protein [Alphaproteobacteria bacterium]